MGDFSFNYITIVTYGNAHPTGPVINSSAFDLLMTVQVKHKVSKG